MNKIFLVFLLVIFCSCAQDRTLLGDWEARDSAESYAEFAVYDNFIQIYSDVAGALPSWDYSIVGDSLHTPILNYKIDWIKKDSVVLRNKKFTIQLKRINGGACLSEVEGEPENNREFMDGFYKRRNAR